MLAFIDQTISASPQMCGRWKLLAVDVFATTFFTHIFLFFVIYFFCTASPYDLDDIE